MNKKSNNTRVATAKSGANLHHRYDSENGLFINFWKVWGGVMYRGKVFQTQTQAELAPSQGKSTEWVGVTVVVYRPFQSDLVYPATMDVNTHNVYIPNWNQGIFPKAKNGGYVGKLPSKK